MGLEYTAISRFDLSCCTGLEVRFTESNNFGEPSVTNILATVDPNTGELLLSSPAGSELPLAATQMGNPYTITHTVTSIINPNDCPLPAELTLPNPTPIVYTYDVTQQQVDDCTDCNVTLFQNVNILDCTPDPNQPNFDLFDVKFGKIFTVPPCCTGLSVTFTYQLQGNLQTQTVTPVNGTIFIGYDSSITTTLSQLNVDINITQITSDINCNLPFSEGLFDSVSYDLVTQCPCTYTLRRNCDTGAFNNPGPMGVTVTSGSSGMCTGGTLNGSVLDAGNNEFTTTTIAPFGQGTYTFIPSDGSSNITLTLDQDDFDECNAAITYYACCDGTSCNPGPNSGLLPCQNGEDQYSAIGSLGDAINSCEDVCNPDTYHICDGLDCDLVGSCSGTNCFVNDDTCGGGCGPDDQWFYCNNGTCTLTNSTNGMDQECSDPNVTCFKNDSGCGTGCGCGNPSFDISMGDPVLTFEGCGTNELELKAIWPNFSSNCCDCSGSVFVNGVLNGPNNTINFTITPNCTTGSTLNVALNCSQNIQSGDYTVELTGLDTVGNSSCDTTPTVGVGGVSNTVNIDQGVIDNCCNSCTGSQAVLDTPTNGSLIYSGCNTASGAPQYSFTIDTPSISCNKCCDDVSFEVERIVTINGLSIPQTFMYSCNGNSQSLDITPAYANCMSVEDGEIVSVEIIYKNLINNNGTDCTVVGSLPANSTFTHTITQSEIDNCCPAPCSGGSITVGIPQINNRDLTLLTVIEIFTCSGSFVRWSSDGVLLNEHILLSNTSGCNSADLALLINEGGNGDDAFVSSGSVESFINSSLNTASISIGSNSITINDPNGEVRDISVFSKGIDINSDCSLNDPSTTLSNDSSSANYNCCP